MLRESRDRIRKIKDFDLFQRLTSFLSPLTDSYPSKSLISTGLPYAHKTYTYYGLRTKRTKQNVAYTLIGVWISAFTLATLLILLLPFYFSTSIEQEDRTTNCELEFLSQSTRRILISLILFLDCLL